MQLQHIKLAFGAVWVVSAVVVGVAEDVTSATGRVALATFGLLPPLGLWFLWNHPSQTMSESIDEGRR
jgi:RsiW-degrading membrane proteinase PrsW (M82 family)